MGKSRENIIDELLVLKSQGGDNKSFSLLVKRWHPKITMMAYRHTRNMEVSKDIAQETWVAVVRGLASLRDPALFRTWLYRIVSHKSVDWIRKVSRERSIMNSEKLKEDIKSRSISTSTEVIELLRKSVNDLPDNQRIVLSMFYLDGSNLREMAKILSIPEGTVKSRLYHAREHLKTIYKNYNHEKQE